MISQSTAHVARQGDAREQSRRALSQLFLLYFWLWIFEGMLRKWILPQFSTPLTVIRDPLAVYIIARALFQGFVRPLWPFWFSVVLGTAMFCTSLLTSSTSMLVMIYGLRANVLHIPLIFIMGQVWDRDDIKKLGDQLLLFALPTAVLCVLQFMFPDSILNLATGGEGLQITGALGRLRASAFFAYPIGVSILCSLILSFALYRTYLEPTKTKWRALMAIACVVLIYAVGISRASMLQGLLVVIVFFTVYSVVYKALDRFIYTLFGVAALLTVLSFVPVFKAGIEATTERLTLAESTTASGIYDGIILRILGGYTEFLAVIPDTPWTGFGLGAGTNAAAYAIGGEYGFLLSEDEWSRLVMESGPILGVVFICLRLSITWVIFVSSLKAFRRGNTLPIVLFSTAFFQLTTGQWGPPTSLGGAILLGGICLAACNSAPTWTPNGMDRPPVRRVAPTFRPMPIE